MRIVIAEIDPERLSQTTALLESAGVEVLAVSADVRRLEDVDRLFQAVLDRFGGLDILVNNVGDFLGVKAAFEDTTEAQLDALYQINLLQVLRTTRAAIPLMRPAGGCIINISTIEAFRGMPTTVAYCTFKAALTGFTQSLGVELGADGIRVNAIAPETTRTAQVRGPDGVPPENRDHIRRWFPLGRFGEAPDVAGAALFLASDVLSGWITGSTIHVDGGALAAGAWMRMPDGESWTHLPIIAGDGYTARPGD